MAASLPRIRTGAGLLPALAVSACAMLGTAPPSHPQALPPSNEQGLEVWRAASEANGRRILVSLDQRHLWLVEGADTLLSAPIAVGSGQRFSYGSQSWHFVTPRGVRRVRAKDEDPLWVPPDWHYFQTAVDRGVEPVHLKPEQRVTLSDGSIIEVRGEQVGRINMFGNFWPFTPGTHIIFDGKLFIPPFGTEQRRVPRTLGTRRIDLGDAYLIHGTYEENSIGRAASAGCIRMYNRDVERLYEMVQVGTAVFIY